MAPDPAPNAEEATERGVGTILLVEDHDQVRDVAQSILRRVGTIDLLLTDVVLPRMNGRQLVERLAPMRPSMRVLYMSGYPDDATLRDGIVDAEIDFLPKPFSPDSLIRTVRRVLRRGEG